MCLIVNRMRVFLTLSIFLVLSCMPVIAVENLKIERVTESVYAVLPVEGGKAFSNSAFILMDDGVLVIDSQLSKELSQELIVLVRKTTDKPITYLLITHPHRDHCGGNASFSSEVKMILHTDALPRMKEEGVALNYPVITTNANMSLFDREKRVRILSMQKAHTEGDLFVYIPDEKVIVAGDLFFNQIIPYVKDGHIEKWLISIHQIMGLDFEKIVPGHGAIADKNELRKFNELLAWAKGVADTEINKGTDRAKIIEAAKKTSLYTSRISLYAHQERLADLLNSAYNEIFESRARFNLQK